MIGMFLAGILLGPLSGLGTQPTMSFPILGKGALDTGFKTVELIKIYIKEKS